MSTPINIQGSIQAFGTLIVYTVPAGKTAVVNISCFCPNAGGFASLGGAYYQSSNAIVTSQIFKQVVLSNQSLTLITNYSLTYYTISGYEE